MDDTAKQIFKGKFIRLVVLLNLNVLLFFLSALLFFLMPDTIRIYVAVFFLILAISLAFYIAQQYRETKAWLDVNAKTD